MSRSQERTRQIARTPVTEAPDRATETEATVTPTVDVAAVVQQVMHTSFGNTQVQSALDGTDSSALAQTVAGELAAATAGLGAMSPDGAALASAGNAALARVASQAAEGEGDGEQGMSQAQALNTLRGGQGQALPDAVRGRMERAFGRDFRGVRVHTGEATQQAAQALGADAVAMGSHLHFGAGQYAPGTQSGDAVIAHELTHVVQAMDGRLPGVGGVSNTSMAAEQEAYANESLLDLGPSTASSVEVGAADVSAADVSAADVSAVAGAGVEGGGVMFSSEVATPAGLDADGLGSGSGLGPADGLSGFGAGGAVSGFGAGGALSGFGAGGALGALGAGGGMAPMAPASLGPAASAPMTAAASAPAMLREGVNPTREEATRETDSESKIRHEMAMGMDLGFRRALDASEGTVAVPKEGSGRVDGVFTSPSKSGHLAIEEYMGVMREVGPDGSQNRSASADNIRGSDTNHSENDGHAHLDGDNRIGAQPETSATPPGGDPVMGGPGGDLLEAGERGLASGPLDTEGPGSLAPASGPLSVLDKLATTGHAAASDFLSLASMAEHGGAQQVQQMADALLGGLVDAGAQGLAAVEQGIAQAIEGGNTLLAESIGELAERSGDPVLRALGARVAPASDSTTKQGQGPVSGDV